MTHQRRSPGDHRMARKKAAPPTPTSAVRGKRFYLDTQIRAYSRGQHAAKIRALGGLVQNQVDASLDYLVLAEARKGSPGKSVAERQAAKLTGASITTLYPDALGDLLLPTRDEALAMLRAGPTAENKRNFTTAQPHHKAGQQIDLSGADFTGLDLSGFKFYGCLLDGIIVAGARLDDVHMMGPKNVDFTRAASYKGLRFSDAEDCNIDGMELPELYVNSSLRCSFRGAKLSEVRFNHATLDGCDFSEADCSQGRFEQGKAKGLRAEKATFTGSNLKGTKWPVANLRGSTFTGARMDGMDLSGADLRECNLENANLSETNLKGADLRGANLRYATLSKADLTGAKVAGADFTGANLRDAVGVPVKGCPSLAAAVKVAPDKGPFLQQLEAGLKDAVEWELSFEVHSPTRGVWRYRLSQGRYGHRPYLRIHSPTTTKYDPDSNQVPDAFAALLDVAASYSDGVPQLDSVTLRPVKLGKRLQQLALQAVCEAFGLPVPEGKDVGKARQAARAAIHTQRDTIVAQLKQGGDAVEAWNKRPEVERKALGNFTGVDLAGASLTGINLYDADLSEANLTGADLCEADLRGAKLRKTILRKAKLRKAVFRMAHCPEADAEGIDLREADLNWTIWRGANLKNADLRGANLWFAKFQGADLTGAKLDGAKIRKVDYDSATKFPVGFKLNAQWIDKSKITTPAVIVAPPKEDLDFAAFYNKVSGLVDAARLSKAVAMLKAEKFQLFAEADADQVAGIVRSQSSFGIYSCRLTRGGQFACATDGLNTCGGLKGAICKHLLVLILGLTKAGQFDPGMAHQWIQMSKQQRQTTDKNALAETLLKYKGVQAGEVDWRPTETVPEDYYAL
jgi:uncharacterized protein YjbI with pentapeptide repeats